MLFDVERASTAGLPKKSCCIDIPVMSGIMIGSFGSVLVSMQVSVKIPGLSPPDGNPVVSTGAADAESEGAVADEPAAPDANALGIVAEAVVAETRLTATTAETAAAEAAARTTAPARAAIAKGSLMDMPLVNVREFGAAHVFTLPEQTPSTAPTFG
jgi:hypothetical protein